MNFRPCLVVPFYNHGHAIARTLARLRASGLPCWVVDDGSDAANARLLDDALAIESAWTHRVRYAPNQGKGMAVMRGCKAALAAGYTHAVQVDADGQHDADDIPKLLALSRQAPAALVTGVPVYDASVPKGRLYGRYITHVWVWVHTLSLDIRDSMCGFRVYPLADTLAVWREEPIGQRMDFDTEIMVRLYWRGTPVRSLPTRVTYPLDGVSHFALLHDNLRISWMHTRLFFGMLLRLPRLLWRRFSGSSA